MPAKKPEPDAEQSMSPDDVFAELEAKANSAKGEDFMPVNLEDMPKPERADKSLNLDDHGGVEENGIIRFGQKAFHADPAKRQTVPSKANHAAGPRRTDLPKAGEFLTDTKSFRDVPYRTKSGSIRVDH